MPKRADPLDAKRAEVKRRMILAGKDSPALDHDLKHQPEAQLDALLAHYDPDRQYLW